MWFAANLGKTIEAMLVHPTARPAMPIACEVPGDERLEFMHAFWQSPHFQHMLIQIILSGSKK